MTVQKQRIKVDAKFPYHHLPATNASVFTRLSGHVLVQRSVAAWVKIALQNVLQKRVANKEVAIVMVTERE